MKLVNELLDYEQEIQEGHCLIFTANSTIDNRGCLVMGAGNALACKKAYPYLPKEFGNLIVSQSEFLTCTVDVGLGSVMAFQTKIHWKRRTPIDLLKESIEELKSDAIDNPERTFHLPCPGVNNGGLSIKKVMPLLEALPNNVIVYYKE